jgi:hypothetical protein
MMTAVPPRPALTPQPLSHGAWERGAFPAVSQRTGVFIRISYESIGFAVTALGQLGNARELVLRPRPEYSPATITTADDAEPPAE